MTVGINTELLYWRRPFAMHFYMLERPITYVEYNPFGDPITCSIKQLVSDASSHIALS